VEPVHTNLVKIRSAVNAAASTRDETSGGGASGGVRVGGVPVDATVVDATVLSAMSSNLPEWTGEWTGAPGPGTEAHAHLMLSVKSAPRGRPDASTPTGRSPAPPSARRRYG